MEIIGKFVTNRLIQIAKCVAPFVIGNAPVVCHFKPFSLGVPKKVKIKKYTLIGLKVLDSPKESSYIYKKVHVFWAMPH